MDAEKITSPSSVSVRRANESDAPVFEKMFAQYILHFKSADPDSCRTFARQRLVSQDSLVLFAEVATHPVGFLQVYRFPDSNTLTCDWKVQDLWVEPGSRRLGAGSALLEHAVGRAREENVQHLVAEVYCENKASLSLMSKFGFSCVGRAGIMMHLARRASLS